MFGETLPAWEVQPLTADLVRLGHELIQILGDKNDRPAFSAQAQDQLVVSVG
ncbi:hypothetical protein [Candidatus Villigracilis saccharophilus]|uniref:hypothetical protein n=1 Tax=Candidatus Villigracilis saccharophilus TaxID=3140684 RepID=UPI003135143A|nr:hypothetical protein [Anaerolineales bacterium]